ncbi:MAG: hypothetical protein Kow00129_12470 [Thermoleophilia bacterium]
MTSANTEVLRSHLSELDGEVRRFAEQHVAELATLDPAEFTVWLRVAHFLAPQRLRDKRSILAAALDGLAAVSAHPHVRQTAHQAVDTFLARSARLVESYLEATRLLAHELDRETFAEITDMADQLARDIDLATAFLERAPMVLTRRDLDFLRAWHGEALLLAETDWWAARGFLQAVGQGAHWLEPSDLPQLSELGARVAQASRHAVKGFFKALPALLGAMQVTQIRDWVELGLEVSQREEDLVLFMSYGSKRSHEAVEALCRETSFSAFRPRVAILLEAFLGRPGVVRSMFDLLDPATVPPDVPAFNDGRALYLRPTLGALGRSPLAMYKLVALHAAAHERFGSFADQELAERLLERTRAGLRNTRGETEEQARLARFLVTLAEDYRIDSALFRTLPGLRQDAELVLNQVYAEFRAELGRRTAATPAAVRAQLAALPFGIQIVEDTRVLEDLAEVMRPLEDAEAGPAESLAAAEALNRMLAPLWFQGDKLADFDLADVPYPPFHDHFSLGLELSGRTPTATGDEKAAPVSAAGESISLPDSLHPSEIVKGLEIQLKDAADSGCDLMILEEEPEEEELSGCDIYRYDEWDHEAGDHRARWCTVRCREIPGGDSDFVRRTLERYQGEVLLIRRQFERLRPERIRRYFRQTDGDELDLDALVETLADKAAGAPLSDKIFVRRDKKTRDVAVLFLLDMSDSTDAPVDGRRVIDVEKEGLVLLSEALEQLDDRYAMLGFTSEGRHRVDLFVIKDFENEFDENVARRIGAIEPRQYTRLGAALRHATERLEQQPAEDKLLVLLSDGRPYDMGYGDMRYATEDVKMALHEAQRMGVKAFCITVDPKGPEYLDDLFGEHRYTVIQNVKGLPTKLPRIYKHLTTI